MFHLQQADLALVGVDEKILHRAEFLSVAVDRGAAPDVLLRIGEDVVAVAKLDQSRAAVCIQPPP